MYYLVNKIIVDKNCYKSSIVLSFVNVCAVLWLCCLLLLLLLFCVIEKYCCMRIMKRMYYNCDIKVCYCLTVHAKTHDTSVNHINSCIFILGEDKNLPVIEMCALTENFSRDFLTDTLTVCIYMYITFSLYE